MAQLKFEIKGVLADGKLDIDKKGNGRINSKKIDRTIKWKIKDKDKDNPVTEISIFSKSAEPYPVDGKIPTDFNDEVKLEVKEEAWADWEYGIKWRDKSGNECTHDPVIAIRPSRVVNEEISFLLKLALVGLTLIGASLLFWKRKKK